MVEISVEINESELYAIEQKRKLPQSDLIKLGKLMYRQIKRDRKAHEEHLTDIGFEYV